jgi:L-ascorbate metabolism protein UlaG (beta-lactamase superfamily)
VWPDFATRIAVAAYVTIAVVRGRARALGSEFIQALDLRDWIATPHSRSSAPERTACSSRRFQRATAPRDPIRSPDPSAAFCSAGQTARRSTSAVTTPRSRSREIAERVAPVNVAILSVGGASPPRLTDGANLTLDNAAALEATRILDPNVVIPIHHDCWSHLTNPSTRSPKHFREAGLGHRLRIISPESRRPSSATA